MISPVKSVGIPAAPLDAAIAPSGHKLSHRTNDIECTIKFESAEVLMPQYRFQLGIKLLTQCQEA
ncbi:MAG: hypothetical protein JWL65_4982 [Gammaproteobacteria bacterium]|nr:hypothetical protein [Gammaproteobacteria bacterium]